MRPFVRTPEPRFLLISLVSLIGSSLAQASTLNSSQARLLPDSSSNTTLPANITTTLGVPDWTSASNNPGTNARIPKSISSSCQAYLARLNSNTKVQACTAPLLNATASLAAGGFQSIKPDQLKSAFDGICAPNSGCEPALIHNILGHLAGNCSQELSQGETSVRTIYDVLYILTPYRVAMCAKDPSTKQYCSSVIASAVVNGTVSKKADKTKVMSPSDFGAMVSSVLSTDKLITQGGTHPVNTSSSLQRRQPASSDDFGHAFFASANATTNTTAAQGDDLSPVYHPNANTYASTNMAFLFLSPDLPEAALCTPCTQSVLAAYIGFEESNPHIGGLSASAYLSGQIKLWKGVKERCGAKFVEVIETDAGIMSSLTNTSGAIRLLTDRFDEGPTVVLGLLVFGSIKLLI